MFTWINQFKSASRQTKYFILTLLLYMIAMIWTTVQAYARLEYSRSDMAKQSYVEKNQSSIPKK